MNKEGDEALFGGCPATGSSAGSAAAVLLNAFRTRNASIGERSNVPPSGGIIPRNMLRYGSHIVLNQRKIVVYIKRN